MIDPLLLGASAMLATGTPAPADQAALPQSPPEPLSQPRMLAMAQPATTRQPAATEQAQASATGTANAAPAPVVRAPRPAFRPINHEEDYSGITPEMRTNLWARLKHIPLDERSYITLGGELRIRPELRIGERWGRGAQNDDGNFQQRTRVWTDLQIGGAIRAFVDIEHATSDNLNPPIAAYEEGRADFNQAFVEGWTSIGNVNLRMRVGRQEVGIGNFRVFDMREGGNARRSLDLMRLLASSGKWDGGFLAGWAVREKFESFNDATNHDYAVTGGHIGRNFGSGGNTSRLETLYVYSRRDGLMLDSAGPARDKRHTVSLRYAGKSGAWDYDMEGIGNWGTMGALTIRAWYASAIVNYALPGQIKPKIGLRVDVGSGDKNPNDGTIGTYSALLPRPITYNGDLGPNNLIVVQPNIAFMPAKAWTVDLAAGGLWRTSKRDAVYSLGGQAIRRGNESDARFVGYRFIVSSRYALNPFTTLGLYTNYTAAGTVIKDSGTAKDLFYGTVFVTFRF